mgnify:CR=1 FL=1
MNVVERQASELQVQRWMGAIRGNVEQPRLPDPELDVPRFHLVLGRREWFGRRICATEHQLPRQATK